MKTNENNRKREGAEMKKSMNHGEYQNRTRSMSEAALRFTANDAREAAEAFPDGENNGYYTDEMHYCLMELKARQMREV